MKSLIAFSHVLLDDVGKWCGVSTPRDHKTVTSRTEHEGLSFLTITLPAFCKDLEKGLSQGAVTDDLFPGFARTGGLPRFLGGFLRQVFDSCSGILLDVPSVEAIRALRQFLMAFGKVDLLCSDERVKAAIDGYVQCEQDIIVADADFAFQSEEFSRTARVLYGNLFDRVDQKVEMGQLVPKHGPGATADRLRGNAKYTDMHWSTRLDEYFPIADYLLPNHRHWQLLDAVDILEPGAEMPVRVITVPKTLKTPRIIAIEPACMQYTQQSLMEVIVEGIEGDELLSPLIGFTDQEPNRLLAKQGSITGALATLDLSEASDRVSNQHVLALLRYYPNVAGAVQACRSTKADVPGHGTLPLRKFASMGSALCFPFEAMTFLNVVVQTIARELRIPVSAGFIRSLAGKVRIYGDDIIVPTEFAPSVIGSLEAIGLKVNRHKSFADGNFRESCGGDYYNGHWVTPVRVRDKFPESHKDVLEIVSAISLRNQLFSLGMDGCVAWLDQRVRRHLTVYPEIPVGSSALGRHSYKPDTPVRMNSDVQAPEFRGPVLKALLPESNLEGVGALMKFFLKRGDMPLDIESFTRSGRPSCVRIITRWQPFV